jgi:hypothetical protein
MPVREFVFLSLSALYDFLRNAAPTYMCWLAGIVACFANWRRQPRVSRLALLPFVLLFLDSFVSFFGGAWLAYAARRRGWEYSEIMHSASILGFCLSLLLYGSAWTLLLLVIFRRRISSGPNQEPK